MSLIGHIPSGGERRWRQPDGGLVIQSRVGAPRGRQGFEKQFFRGVEVGLPGWERAHSQGNITGHESRHGIRYAPSEGNQAFQRPGIERFIRELFEEAAPDVEFFLTTTTYSHGGTLRLREIQYRVDARRRGRVWSLFEAAIEVQDDRLTPRVSTYARERTPRAAWEGLLK